MPSELMNVTPENVLQARAVVLAEAQSFQQYVTDNFGDSWELIGLCGGDPISRDAKELFSKKIGQNAVGPALQYVQRLLVVADQLARTARSFGITEQRIADSFVSTSGADSRR